VTEWYELHSKINKLQQNLKEKPVEHTLDLMLSLLSQIISRHERDLLESGQSPFQRSLNESHNLMLTARIETLETDAQWGRRRIGKKLEAIDAKLDAILARLPEPPQGFDG
jgi:hypothetical protein